MSITPDGWIAAEQLTDWSIDKIKEKLLESGTSKEALRLKGEYALRSGKLFWKENGKNEQNHLGLFRQKHEGVERHKA